MEKIRLNIIIFLMGGFSLFSCKGPKNNLTTLFYDYYEHDTLMPGKTMKIVYDRNDKRKYSKVTVMSLKDSIITWFYQEVTDSGILRSNDTSGFRLSHSFTSNKDVELRLKNPQPYFLNVLTKRLKNKDFSIGEGENGANVILFDEAIPWYSYTCSYYLKSKDVFLIFYNSQVNEDKEYSILNGSYYLLSDARGMDIDRDFINNLSQKIIADTSFFVKYYKFPTQLPPTP